MAVVRMPDGQLARFPDEMSREDIKAFVAQKYPNAYDTQKQGTQTRGERALNSLKRDLQDIAYGARKAVSGATLGASDWALRKLGVNDEAYLQDRGLPAKGAGLVAEIGGNIMGAGGAITKGLANKGLKGLKLALSDAGLQGAAYGATSSDRLADLPVNVAAGGAVGAATGGALTGAGRAIKRLFPSLNVIGKKSGLENALDDIETLRAINRGSRASDEVAQGVLNRAQGVKGTLNDEMAQALEAARGRELDIQNAIDTQQERLGKYVAKNADKELFSTEEVKLPTREQILAYTAESKLNPNNDYTRADALSALEKRADNLGVELYNDIDKVKEAQLKLIRNREKQGNIEQYFRNKDEIKTFNEALKNIDSIGYDQSEIDEINKIAKDALKTGKIKVYSDENIEKGALGSIVSPSKDRMSHYAKDGIVYEMEVPLQDVAWNSPTEGQYAPVDFGKGHFIKEDGRNPFARTLENTVKKPDLTYSQIRKNKTNDYYIKKYDILENSFSEDELNKAFDEFNPIDYVDGLSGVEQRNMFKKFADEYKKHLMDYKDGTLFDQPNLPHEFYATLNSRQKAAINEHPDMFMDLLNYFDDRVSDKGITELLDMVVIKDGKPYTKFNAQLDYLVDELNKEATSNISASGRVMKPTDTGYIGTASQPMYNITLNSGNVNKNIPKLSNYTQGLTDFQVDALNKALAEGASKSTTPLGTLGATHRGQEVLNDMIEASFDKSIIGTKRPTTDTRQLMALKERFNQILEPSGVKPFDESYSKALGLRTNFEKGYNFKPSETKFESLGLEKARDKRAFLQGRLAKILDDVTDEKNVATLIKKDQNTLKKLMTPKKFETLMKTADKIEGNYRNLKNLETTANSALRRSSDASRPLSELGESKGSIVGSALDKLFGGIYRHSDVATARRILSGQPIPQNSILLNNLRNSTPAVSGIMVEELLKN